jgi:SAM-dependent methyltransferase
MSWLKSHSESHQAREVAESFGSDPERYDRARPRYPDEMVKAIVAASPGSEVLDVGCGTGIAARQFREAGCRVLGVEVDERMATFARRDGLEVEVAKFEQWEPAGRSFNAVISGQTWHWIEPIAGASKAAAVLRPSGRLALFWNVPDASPDVAARLSEVYRRAMGDYDPWARSAVAAYGALLNKAVEGIRQVDGLDEPKRWRFDWERSYERDEWLETVLTGGDAGQFSPDQLERLMGALGAAIDSAGGSIRMSYATLVLTAQANSAVAASGPR